MTFQKEADFEEALIKVLADKGWEKEVIKNPTEQDLIRNWAKILFDNNRGIDRLNNYPLTDGEMQQIIEQITELRTPLKLNCFINGKTVSIKRDNPDDKLHFGTEISLKIYDRREIAAGQSRYQIVQQPVFPSKSKMLNDRRGDLMLLINGMPVIHIELKRSGVPVSQEGENGTGKEMLAREIHLLSPRKDEAMVPVDMGAITETLFESELFGHVKGAFTDARTDRPGKFEVANNGSLFLDEIGNLSYHLQAKLLTALQRRSIVRVGSNTPIPINIRLICATNRDLQEMVQKEQFREDLLYRINTIDRKSVV